MDTARINAAQMAFIGGGNMASAIVAGLRRSGFNGRQLVVVEPVAQARERLAAEYGVRTLAEPDASLASADVVVWAVKPQSFPQAAAALGTHAARALHLSIMAGIRSDAIAAAAGTQRVVRTMPNTPAMIGRGIAGLYARDAVDEAGRALAESVLAPTGELLWVAAEDDLDAVTALSGSGPAYVFYLIEAMIEAAQRMGLSADQGKRLALATFSGAAELAARSNDSPQVLRERVTSKGGTTHAAITSLQADGVAAAMVRAVLAAQQRAAELGRA
jgi:pyrroline-5-carboxylate reductase